MNQGTGFDLGTVLEKAKDGEGFGLFSIRERLELMGGSVAIESSPGGGTAISMYVAIEPAENRIRAYETEGRPGSGPKK